MIMKVHVDTTEPTFIYCDECHEKKQITIKIVENYLCLKCVRQAYALLAAKESGGMPALKNETKLKR